MGETQSVAIPVDPDDDPSSTDPSGKPEAPALHDPTGEPPPPEGDLIGGKFKSQEDLLEAYQELERKQSTSTEGPALQITKKAGETAETPKFDAEKYTQELMETGELSDATKQEITGLGIDESIVNGYIEGLYAIRQQRDTSLLQIVGGQEQFDKIANWAKANLSDGEVAAIQTQINSSDLSTSESALRGLMARFGTSPMGQETIIEGAPGGPSVAGFKSNEEMTDAMSVIDERGYLKYEKDPAYRKEIEARIAAS